MPEEKKYSFSIDKKNIDRIYMAMDEFMKHGSAPVSFIDGSISYAAKEMVILKEELDKQIQPQFIKENNQTTKA